MKTIKRTVAAILATLMLATSTSFTLAAEYDYSAKDAEAVGKVSAAGIMVGDENGDFMPEKSLTRAEAAKIIVVMKGISDSAVKAAAGTTMFNDVEATSWASGYINQASKLGIVKGVSATEFAPTREVTIQEFVTMAVRALGAGQLVDSEGTWPSNYVNFANENKILDDVNSLPANTAKRVEAAMIVKNCLTAEMWGKTAVKTNGEITWEKNGKTIIEHVLDLEEIPVCGKAINVKEHSIKLESGSYDVVESFDLSKIKAGITYHAFKNNKGELTGLWIEDDTVEFTAIADGYDSEDEVITLTVDGKDKEYKIAANAEKVIENEQATNNAITSVAKNKDAFGTITLNDKNEIVTMSIYQYKNYFVVDEVTSSTVKASSETVNGADYKTTNVRFNIENNDYTLLKDGKAINFKDLEEDDAVRLYVVEGFDGNEDHDKYVAEVISPVTGKVTATGSDYIKIDGKKYETVIFTKATTDPVAPAVNLAKKFKLNDEVEAYLNNEGKIVMFKVAEEDKNNSVAIVSYLKPWEDKYGDENYDVKLTYMDGTESEVLNVDYEGIYKEIKKGLKIDSTDKKLVKYDDVTVFTSTTNLDALPAFNADQKETIGKNYAVSVLGTTTLNLGSLICYKVNGDELVIVPNTDDDFIPVETTGIKVDKKYTYLTNEDAEKLVVFDKNTVLYEIEEDKANSWKVNKVSVDDLEDTPIASGNDVYAVNVDEKTLVADYVIITDVKFRRTTETNFAYIKEISDTEYDEKDAQEVTFVMLDGTEETYIYCDSEADESVIFDEDSIGQIVDLEIKGELIMNATYAEEYDASEDQEDTLVNLGYDNTDVTYVKDVIGDRLILTTGEDLVLDDNVLVIRLKDTLKFKAVKDINSIKEYDSDEAADGKAQDTIVAIYSYIDDDDEASVVAVYYLDAEDVD